MTTLPLIQFELCRQNRYARMTAGSDAQVTIPLRIDNMPIVSTGHQRARSGVITTIRPAPGGST